MKPIDFDARYAEYAESWMRKHMKDFKTIEQMEAHLPELYLRWLNRKQDWLDGLSPAEHFAAYTDANVLTELLTEYVEHDVDVPDLLLERLRDLGEIAVEPLMEIAANHDNEQELRAFALNTLIEIGSRRPMSLCFSLIDNRVQHDDLADVAAELLESLAQVPVDEMLARLPEASDDALATYLDLLSNYPGDSRVFEYTRRQFWKDETRRALYASYLGKLGDEDGIEELEKALGLSELSYLDYIEIRNAIEQLGGEVKGNERSFDGDPYYESMRLM